MTPSDAALPLTACDARGLVAIDDAIHDMWFGLERLARRGTTITIPVTREENYVGALPGTEEMLLHVRNVVDVRIDDRARIAWYDINELVFDERTNELCLRSGFPLEIAFRVETLTVELAGAELGGS